MRKYKGDISAKFCREPFVQHSSIKVSLRGVSTAIPLWQGNIEYCARALSEKELEEVIAILSQYKAVMLDERNFPPVYEEMLSDLIKTQRERYGVRGKKEERRYETLLNLYEIEELLKQHFNRKEVRIDRVLTVDNRDDAKWISLGEKDRTLYISFFVGEEEER